jgi:hypothetical protein
MKYLTNDAVDYVSRSCRYEGIQGVGVFIPTEGVTTLAYAGGVDVTSTPWDDSSSEDGSIASSSAPENAQRPGALNDTLTRLSTKAPHQPLAILFLYCPL